MRDGPDPPCVEALKEGDDIRGQVVGHGLASIVRMFRESVRKIESVVCDEGREVTVSFQNTWN